jgi:hypothetical protein
VLLCREITRNTSTRGTRNNEARHALFAFSGGACCERAEVASLDLACSSLFSRQSSLRRPAAKNGDITVRLHVWGIHDANTATCV